MLALSYLQQLGTSFFSLWYLTHAVQSLWRGQSFSGQGQLGAVAGISDCYVKRLLLVTVFVSRSAIG
jgi:hypothetical protein